MPVKPKNICTKSNLNDLVEPSFQGVNRLFVLSFENENGRTSHSKYYLPKVEIKGYNVKVDNTFLINQKIIILKHMKTFENLLLVKEMITQLVVC